MNFCEAMELLKTGKKVTRETWRNSIYFCMHENKVMSYQPRLMDYVYNEDIMVSEGWEILGESGTFSFCNIIPFLIEGKAAKISDWDDSFIFLDQQTGRLVVRMMECFPFLPGFDAFVATDWAEQQ